MVLYVSLRLHDMLHLLEESHVISVDLLVALLLKLQKMERSVLCAATSTCHWVASILSGSLGSFSKSKY